VQILLERELRAGLADERVHGVALVLVGLVLVGVHGADEAQQVRGVLGVVLAHGAGFDHDAGHAQLHDGGQILRVHVGRERVVLEPHAVDAAQLELVAHREHLVDLLRRPVVGDLVVRAQVAHERRGGDVGVVVVVLQELAEVALPDAGQLVRVIGVGPLLGDGEMALVADAQLVAELQHAQKALVGGLRVEEHVVDDDEVVARAVRDEHVAVAVEDIAARGGDRRPIGHGVGLGGGLGRLRRDGLQLVEPQRKQAHHEGHDHEKYTDAKTGTAFHQVPTFRIPQAAQ
jgi:hypothetical protein